jgi:hypothetical protein
MTSVEHTHETGTHVPPTANEAYEEYGETEGAEDGHGTAASNSEQELEKGQNPLEPVQSEKPSVNNINSIPNGGLVAWLQVVGGFFLMFNSW